MMSLKSMFKTSKTQEKVHSLAFFFRAESALISWAFTASLIMYQNAVAEYDFFFFFFPCWNVPNFFLVLHQSHQVSDRP